MNSIATLALNGEGVPLKNMRVTLTMQFQDKEQSGQTSSTAGQSRERRAKSCAYPAKCRLKPRKC